MNAYRCCLFNMMTYLLLNSEYGIGCGYSPVSTWFGDVCGNRTDFSIFSSILCLFFQILFVAAAYAKSPRPMQYRVPQSRPPARRRRIVPCDLRLRVCRLPPLFDIMFLVNLCSKKS